MNKRLVIAEKPSVARDIAEALAPNSYESKDGGDWFETDDYLISFAVGHLLELNEPEEYQDEWKSWSLKHLPILPNEFSMSPRDSKALARLKLLKKLAARKEVSGLVNACDAGREGEHIFRTIEDWIDSGLPAERLWLNSLTVESIRDGFGSLVNSEEYGALADSARCRAESDWLIGMNATRALTVRLKSLGYKDAWTAGRVQTPTLGMVVARELEIYRHRPRPYWEIKAQFQVGDLNYEADWNNPTPVSTAKDPDQKRNRIFDPELLKSIAQRLEAASEASASDKITEAREGAPIPFDLTSLQREANKRFGMTAKQALDTAQRLYLNKLLTYPRTDSRFLSRSSMLPELDKMLGTVAGAKDYASIVGIIRSDGPQNINRVFDDKKVSDHHAIIPAGVPSQGLEGSDRKIYDLVTRQFLASLMGPATWTKVERSTLVDGDLLFRSSGKVLKVPGWLRAMGKEAGAGSHLQPLPNSPATVKLNQHEVTEKETKPKLRLTEANVLSRMANCGKDIDDDDLSEAMKDKGLGTPATRADTIERLIRREYLRREGRSLVPTPKAIRLVEILQEVGANSLVSVELTGAMEQKLRKVADGSHGRTDYMEQQRKLASELADLLRNFNFDDLYPDRKALGPSPANAAIQVKETPWGFDATDEAGDSLFIWKDFRGHVLQAETIQQLLADPDLKAGPIPIPGRGRGAVDNQVIIQLVRLSDEVYAGLLAKGNKRKPSRWRIEAVGIKGQEDAAAASEADQEPEDFVNKLCTCSKFEVEIVETNLRYVDKDHVGSTERPVAQLPKLVCKREITREEAQAYFEEGRTELLHNFTSKRNRPFNAILYLKANGRHGFEFENRGERRGRARS